MPRIAEATVVEAVLTGIMNSHKTFLKGTGGLFVSHGPEYAITTHILQELWKADIIAVPEHNLRELMAQSGTKGKGKYKGIISLLSRCDIAVFNRSAAPMPLCAIEVKRQARNKGSLEKDFARLKELIVSKTDSTSFGYGISAFYIARDTTGSGEGQNDGSKKIENYLKELEKTAKEYANDNNMTAKMHTSAIELQSWGNIWDSSEGISACSAACIVFKHKPPKA